MNISKIKDNDFLNLFETSLKKYFEENFTSENFYFRDKVFFCVLEETAKNKINEKNYLLLIKNFIKKYIMISDFYLETKHNSHYLNLNKIFPKIFDYLDYLKIIFEFFNEKNFMTDFIIFLNKVIFSYSDNSSENISNHNSNFSFNINNIMNLNNINSSREHIGSPSLSKLNYNLL